MPMDILSHGDMNSWKTEGHLGYRGDRAWPKKRATVIEMADLKALFIKIDCSFIQVQTWTYNFIHRSFAFPDASGGKPWN